MKAIFIELPAFERQRAEYLNDDGFRSLQNALLLNPTVGEVMEGTGGLRKMRHADAKRGKGKRGGLRIIYYWWEAGRQFWLFTLYDKSELEDLTPRQRGTLRERIKQELAARSRSKR